MAANNSSDGQRSEMPTGSDFPRDTSPKAVPTSKLPDRGNGSDEDAKTSESGAVDSKPSSKGADKPGHFVAELATVSKHTDLDHLMPDAPPLNSAAAGTSGGAEEEEEDVEMKDAPPLHPMPVLAELDAVDTSVPEGPKEVRMSK